MANILITYISKMSENLTSEHIMRYKCDLSENEEISAVLTNEAAVKYLIKYFSTDNQTLDRIIALCTDNVVNDHLPNFNNLTTIEYFENLFSDIYITKISVSSVDDSKEIMEIMELLNPQDNIYIDITGGLRDAVYMLTLIGRFCEFNGNTVEKVLYSQVIGEKIIKNFTPNFRMLDLLNGMSEFLSAV